jgi:hypothetical protein
MALSYTEILVEDEIFHIFTLPDRRPTAGASQPVKWLYQMIVESYLYHNGDAEARGTGAFYRLLQRTPGAAGRALCLRKASVGQGLITDAEWDLLREPLESSVRVLTLVPVDVAVKAITVFGETDRSAKLIEALGYDRPSEWDEAGEEEGEEEGEEGEEERSHPSESCLALQCAVALVTASPMVVYCCERGAAAACSGACRRNTRPWVLWPPCSSVDRYWNGSWSASTPLTPRSTMPALRAWAQRCCATPLLSTLPMLTSLNVMPSSPASPGASFTW